jgi:5-methyltetrahydrofolate--homocysteine methyltransferase
MMTHRLLEILKSKTVIFDGGMGSMLIARGLGPGESPEIWNLEKPESVAEVHALYYAAGAEVVHTNTFGASPIKLADSGLAEQADRINRRAAEIAGSVCPAGRLVAGDLGPTGKFFQPIGNLDPQAAERSYRRQAEALLAGGVHLISIETMFSLDEALAALRGAKSLGNVFVIASLTYNRTKKGFFTMMGDGVAQAVRELEDAGADAIGSNCSLGSAEMIELTAAIRAATHKPVLIQPNAGKPLAVDDAVVYQQTPAEFAADGRRIKAAGADMIGGCCGTTPDFIKELAKAVC